MVRTEVLLGVVAAVVGLVGWAILGWSFGGRCRALGLVGAVVAVFAILLTVARAVDVGPG